MSGDLVPVHRADDGELCGHVRALADGTWQSCTVWGGALGRHDALEEARTHVLQSGLAALAERWWYRADDRTDAPWEVVCIVEASPDRVRLALGYYSMPGVPTVTLTRAELDERQPLRLDPPD